MPEPEIYAALPKSYEVGNSQGPIIIVDGDDMPDWSLLSESHVQFFHDGKEVNISPHSICDVELLIRVPHFLWAFDKQKFLMLILLCVRRSTRCLSLPLESTATELNLSARDMAFWSATQVCLTYSVSRARFDINLKMRAISHIVNILREILHVVNRVLTKSLHFFSRILIVRFIVLMSVPSSVYVQEHEVLKCLRMESGLWRNYKSN